MVWDLRGALLKKEERETSRWLDFEFRQRARSMRILAKLLEFSDDDLVRRIVLKSDEEILMELELETGLPTNKLGQLHAEASRQARTQLIQELGDPRPYRLA